MLIRLYLIALSLLATACATLAPPRPPVPIATGPNIVLIVAEDLSPRIGAYGDRLARTPNIDRLAREGVLFANAFTTAPVCAPSRAALITGVYAQSLGAQHMRTSRAWDARDMAHTFSYLAVPPPEVKAFPEYLRGAGYFTLNQRKTDYQFGEPFTIWDVNDPTDSNLLVWREAPPGQPFFAMLNPQVTHESDLWPKLNPRGRKGLPPLTDPNAVTVSPYLADTPLTRIDIARQYDDVALLDSQVGEILDALAQDGLLSHTIVIFTTDHGDGLPHAKRRAYEAGLHVPLIVRFPDGRDAGTLRSDLVSFVDLAPTILALARVSPPRRVLRGQPIFGDSHQPERPYVFAAADRMDRSLGYWRSVIDSGFQYLVNRMPEQPLLEHIKFRDELPSMQELWRLHAEGRLTPLQESQFTSPRPEEELYDLAADPDETHNLAADPSHSADLARLRAALADFEAVTDDWSHQSERDMAERMWPGLVQPTTEPPVVTRTGESVSLTCPTAGASIGYRLDGDPNDRWRLYVGPIAIPADERIEAKAVRYGYQESAVIEQ